MGEFEAELRAATKSKTLKIVSVASPVIIGQQTLVVLTADGRLFRLDRNPKDFGSGVPGHKAELLWTEIEGPV